MRTVLIGAAVVVGAILLERLVIRPAAIALHVWVERRNRS